MCNFDLKNIVNFVLMSTLLLFSIPTNIQFEKEKNPLPKIFQITILEKKILSYSIYNILFLKIKNKKKLKRKKSEYL